jgi:ribosomal protein L4
VVNHAKDVLDQVPEELVPAQRREDALPLEDRVHEVLVLLQARLRRQRHVEHLERHAQEVSRRAERLRGAREEGSGGGPSPRPVGGGRAAASSESSSLSASSTGDACARLASSFWKRRARTS